MPSIVWSQPSGIISGIACFLVFNGVWLKNCR
jgi:hypothetical protein